MEKDGKHCVERHFHGCTRKVRHQKLCADCAKEQKKLNKKANKLKKNITK